MPRILYALLSSGGVRGGHKMTVRHVEALRNLGFDAYLYLTTEGARPVWLAHAAPIVVGGAIRSDDIIVVPEDDASSLAQMASRPERTVVFYQGPHATAQIDVIGTFDTDRFPVIITVGRRHTTEIRRLFPGAQVAFVPCFADERIFAPATAKTGTIVYSAHKRPRAAVAISNFYKRLHPRHADIAWTELSNAAELGVAETLGRSSMLLSLGLFESVGLMPLEAMASECICAGFTGVGGWEYATADNGFWVADDDYIAATDALAMAADLIKTGGSALRAMKEAGRETAAQWSYGVFLEALERVWSELAPQARIHRPR
jgi:hypothetical protein